MPRRPGSAGALKRLAGALASLLERVDDPLAPRSEHVTPVTKGRNDGECHDEHGHDRADDHASNESNHGFYCDGWDEVVQIDTPLPRATTLTM